MMKRRDFLALAGGMAAGPFAAWAQAPKVLPRIGVLAPSEREPVSSQIRAGLAKLGYVESQTIQIEYRAAAGSSQLLVQQAKELVRLNVDLIVAHQTPAVMAAMQATRRIPIVMAASADPVGMGFVASLARPGGNVTGMSGTMNQMAPKLFELMKEMLPAMRSVVVLGNADDPYTKVFLAQIADAGRKLGIDTTLETVRGAGAYERVFSQAVKKRADAVIMQPSLLRKAAVELAFQHRIPAFSPARAFTEEGGLMSYSGSFTDAFLEAAMFVDKILKGAKPADLPVQQPNRFELVVNLRTAKLLGVAVPPAILLRADKVIE